jgi:5-methylcytosine-specific restriction endonuclease McrA
MEKKYKHQIDRDILYQLYIVEDKSIRDIEKILGVGRTTINQRLKDYSIPLKPTGGEAHKGKHYPAISEAKKGHPVSDETRERIRHQLKGRKHTEEEKQKISEAIKGEKNPFYGKKHTEETRKRISEAGIGKHNGEKSAMWKGGITPITDTIRHSIETKLWRESCMARDNWTCQKCGKQGGYLEVHHIKNFADYPELRFAIDNGITLCKKCHLEFHKQYGFTHNNEEQLQSFLQGGENGQEILC